MSHLVVTIEIHFQLLIVMVQLAICEIFVARAEVAHF